MSRRTSRTAVVVPLAALALLLGACSGDGEPADTPSATQKADKAGTDDDATTPPAEDETDTSAAGGDECLIGEWVVDADQQIAATTEMFAGTGLEVTNISVTGEGVTEFTATDVISTYADQVSEVTLGMDGQEIRTVTRQNGTTAGSYSVADGQLTMSDIDGSALELTVETYLNGTLQPVDDSLAAAQAEQLVRGMEVTMAYTCDGDTMTMTTPDLGTGLSIETVLHRR